MSAVHRDRFDDSRTTVSRRTDGGGKVKVTKYIVKNDDDAGPSYARDSRSAYAPSRSDDSRSTFRDDYGRGNARVVEDIRIVRKSREDDSPPPPRREIRYEPREERRGTITVERDEVARGRDNYWDRQEEVKDRELVVSRVSGRDDRREVRGFGDYELVSRPRSAFEDRDVERIVRKAEYYTQPPPPAQQTIIIRQEPIIIRERVRDDDYQIVKRVEVEDDKSTVVSRRTKEPRDEEYFYEKKVRERIAPRRDSVSPGDSVSQVGRRNKRDSSDDSIVYVRKEKITETYGSDDEDDHRGRNLAAGALAGVAAAELIRNHKQKEAKETTSGIGRVGVDVGAGAAGAAAVEVVRRIRSKSRTKEKDQSRDRSGGFISRYIRRDSRPQSRSSSSSSGGARDKLKTLGGIGLAAAAIAAGAAIANKKLGGGDDKSDRGRSRSRSRSRRRAYSRSRSRSSELSSLENDSNARDDRNPKVRAAKIAGAGALGAAATALFEHNRNKDQSGSQNRIKQGIPIALGAVGTAALASLYENRKAKEESLDILDNRGRGSGSRSRSRSRSRSQRRLRSRSRRGSSRSRSRSRRGSSTYYDDASRAAYDDPAMVSYGDRPMQGTIPGPGYYGQRAPNEGYYNNSQRDLVPAAPAPDAYNGSGARARSLSRSRARSLSSDSYDESHNRRRGGGLRNVAAAAAAGGAAAHAENQRNRRRRRRSRQDRSYTPDQQYYNDSHREQNYGPADPYASQSGFHDPAVSNFPPPPGSMNYNPGPGSNGPPFSNPAYGPDNTVPGPSYAPQEYPPPPPGTVPSAGPYATGPDPYAQSQNRYTPRYGGADVSLLSAVNDQRPSAANGVNTRGVDVHESPLRVPLSSAAKAYTPPNYNPVLGVAHDRTASEVHGRQNNVSTSRSLSESPEMRRRSDMAQPAPTYFASKHTSSSRPNENESNLRSEARAGRNRRHQEAQYNNARENLPSMPSPDLRPPSEGTTTSSPDASPYANASGGNRQPSMPNLFVPSPPHGARARSLSADTSVSDMLASAERRKSVSFNPQTEYQEAPASRVRSYSDSQLSNPDISQPRQRSHESRDDRYQQASAASEFDDRHRRARADPGRERAASHSGVSDSSRPRRDRSPSTDDSGETIDLPARFDDRGNRRSNTNGRTADQDLIANKIDELLGGKAAGVGKLFSSFLGGGSSGNTNSSSSKRDRESHNRGERSNRK